MELAKSLTVEDEMKKNSELNKSDLEMLRDWLKKQPHLPPISDFELSLFLHSNYYRIEPTKTTIDAFFTVRTHVPEFFSERDPLGTKELREIMKVVCYVELPETTPEGYRVIFTKLLDPEPSRYVWTNVLKLLTMRFDLSLFSSSTCPGYVLVCDMHGVVFGHLARVSTSVNKKFIYYLQEGLPIRMKGIHFINAVPVADMIVNLFVKPAFSEELLEVFKLHSGTETLKKFVPIDLLPTDNGGKAGFVKDLWAADARKIEEHRSWFQEGEMRKANEAARPGKPKNVTDMFGVDGSFKKLELD